MLLPLPPFSWQNIHPILVNFTAALVPASIASDLLGKFVWRDSLSRAAWWMLLYATLITPFTVLFGWLWKGSLEDAAMVKETIFVHQWLGTALAASFILLASWRGTLYVRGKSPNLLYFLLALLVMLLLGYQGHLGGSMVFG
jgi:uncharacterized membrane protein